MRRGKDRIPNTGDYRQVVAIEQPPTARDDSGQPTGDWTAFATWYCSAVPAGGIEQFQAGAYTARAGFVFEGHYLSGVVETMRLSMGGRLFEITNVNNVDELNRTLRITAAEGRSHGNE